MSRLFVMGYSSFKNFQLVRRVTFLLVSILAGFTMLSTASATETTPMDSLVAAALSSLSAGQIETAEMQCEAIENPVAKLYVKACVWQAKGDLKNSLETVALLIAQYPNDSDWTEKSELMSAVLYMELGMLNSADATARQIQLLYEGTGAAETATLLRSKIETLKKESAE